MKISGDIPATQTVTVEHSGSDDLDLYGLILFMNDPLSTAMRCYPGPSAGNYIFKDETRTLECGTHLWLE